MDYQPPDLCLLKMRGERVRPVSGESCVILECAAISGGKWIIAERSVSLRSDRVALVDRGRDARLSATALHRLLQATGGNLKK
jgi:hypothetical protein